MTLSVDNGRLGQFGGQSKVDELVGKTFEIVDGPGKWRLVTTFGNMGEEGPNYVVFHFVPYNRVDESAALIEAEVTILGHHNKYAEKWTFTAETRMLDGRRRQISGTYSTRDRKGHFRVVS